MAFRLAILAPTAVVCITTSIKTTRNVDAVLETLNGEVFNQHEAAEALHKEYAKTEAECTEEQSPLPPHPTIRHGCGITGGRKSPAARAPASMVPSLRRTHRPSRARLRW